MKLAISWIPIIGIFSLFSLLILSTTPCLAAGICEELDGAIPAQLEEMTRNGITTELWPVAEDPSGMRIWIRCGKDRQRVQMEKLPALDWLLRLRYLDRDDDGKFVVTEKYRILAKRRGWWYEEGETGPIPGITADESEYSFMGTWYIGGQYGVMKLIIQSDPKAKGGLSGIVKKKNPSTGGDAFTIGSVTGIDVEGPTLEATLTWTDGQSI